MEKQIAEFVLAVMNRSTVPATDADLQNAVVSRNFLKQIMEGKLVVLDVVAAEAGQKAIAKQKAADGDQAVPTSAAGGSKSKRGPNGAAATPAE